MEGLTGPEPAIASALEILSTKYPDKIPVHLVDHHAYVWRVEDVSRLRAQWHICGQLSGSLPLIPQQNVFLGLPLQLFAEEVVFLLRSKAIVLISDPDSFEQATAKQQELYAAAFQDDLDKQARKAEEEARAGKAAEIEKLLNKAAKSVKGSVAGSEAGASASANGEEGRKDPPDMLQKALQKRLQREEKRRMSRMTQDAEIAEKAVADESALSLFASEPSSPASRKGKEKAKTNTYIWVTDGAVLESRFPSPWYQPDNDRAAQNEGRMRVFSTLSAAKRAGVWAYPKNRWERAKCAVFEDFHAKGYYMGKGLRFGGDFVVYPGDPLRYHSHFTATVRESPDAPLSAMDLVANGRLGTAVKKAHCVSSATGVRTGEETDEAEDDISHPFGKVDHFSLTWSGFGT